MKDRRNRYRITTNLKYCFLIGPFSFIHFIESVVAIDIIKQTYYHTMRMLAVTLTNNDSNN